MTTSTALVLDINNANLDQQQAFAITAANRDEILQAASSIRLGDVMSVHDFGRSATDASYLDTMLEDVKVIDQKESGKQLNEIAFLSRQISDSVRPSDLQRVISRIPIIGFVISRLTFMQRRALNRFDSVKGQMDILADGISSISTGYLEQNVKLDAMYNDVLADIRAQGINIVASKLVIDSIEGELQTRQEEFKKNKTNTLLSIEINDIQYQLDTLKKRRKDMISMQQKSFDDLTMLRMMQQNNLALVDKFRSVEELTLPAAKRGHLIVDALEKQNAGVKLIEAIDDATNALALRQAELVKDNTIRIAKQSHRSVYDAKTLDRISTLMNEAIAEAHAIHKSNSDGHLALEKRAIEWQEERRQRLINGMGKNKLSNH
uniref:toxic anion resistance protein n=1 Tax=Providencia rettgeri TaxID=587 RepID=UPI001F23665D